MMTRMALGIDGGGTRTRAVLVEEAGRVRGVGQAGPGNYHDMGGGRLRENMRLACERAWQAAGETMRPADAVYVGLASVVLPEEHAAVRAIAAQLKLAPAEWIETGHDLRNALAGGLAGRPGMVLVVGTGSACFGRSAAGSTWKAGGWGSRLDDMGSATHLGLMAMAAAIRDEDGRGVRTVLKQRVLEALSLGNLRELVQRVNAGEIERPAIAALARLVTAASAGGDEAAMMILRSGADELALMVRAVAEKLDWAGERVRLAMTGGLVDGCAAYRGMIVESVGRCVAGCEVVEPVLGPSLGAGLIALGLLGVSPTQGVVGVLKETGAVAMASDGE